MKKLMSMFAMLVMIGALCVGCKDAEKPKPEAQKQSKKGTDKNWKPETASKPAAKDGHEGHDHGPGGHDH